LPDISELLAGSRAAQSSPLTQSSKTVCGKDLGGPNLFVIEAAPAVGTYTKRHKGQAWQAKSGVRQAKRALQAGRIDFPSAEAEN
jgi:hypothetical protein